MALTEEGLIHVPTLYSRWVRLPSGARAHYVPAGETGPAVVLLHGAVNGSSGTAGWRFMAPYLGEHGFRVFCPDLPAFGINEGVDEAYEPGFLGAVDFLQDFVDSLCLDRFHLGGNSNGSLTAMSYAATHPERVISMPLIGTAGDMLGLVDAEAAKRARPADAPSLGGFDGSEASMRKVMGAIIYRDEGISDDLVTMRTLSANQHIDAHRVRGEAIRNPAPNIKARLNLKGRFDKLDIPTIYVCGKQDATATEATFALQEDALPNVQVFLVDECGHQAQTDRPELVNEVFLEFLRDGKVGRKTADAAGVSKRRPEHANLVSQT